MGMEAGEGKKLHYGSNITAPPINHPRLNGLLGISDNAKSPTKNNDKCHRFSLKLFLADDKTFPEFDYITLLKDMKLGNDVSASGDTLFPEDDTDDLKALAQKFEQKYAPKKKESYRKHKNEFVDVGFGYDESDNFIDNTEAYDECVPSDWTTEHGGFYINQGNLDFRPCERYSGDATKKDQAAYKKKKKKPPIDGKATPKNPKELSTQKKKKHLLHKEKQRKRQESLQKATKILAKKKKPPIILDESSQDIPLAQLNKSLEKEKVKVNEKGKQPGSSHVSIDTSFEDNIPLAKIAKSSPAINLSGNQLGKTSDVNTTPTQKSEKMNTSTSKESASPLNTVLVKTSENSPSNLKQNGEEIKAKVETPLPEGLANELLEDIEKLKEFAGKYVKGKGFFTVEVNKIMLSFARSCRQLNPKLRNAVYDHMLCYLPCARDTLVKRCRRLIVQHQREMEDEPIRILKEAIDDSMLEQKKEYDEEVAEALQEQAREQIKQTGMDPMKTENSIKPDENETNDDDEKKSIDDAKKYFPKKRYSWTEEIRKLLCDVVKVRVGLFKMSKSKSMTAEEYIKDFLESEIRKLWPKGWMTSRILYKESRIAHQEITQPGKGKNRFTKLPCGYPIANLTVGESTSSPPPYILKSGPKTPVSSTSSVKALTSTPISSNSPLNTPVSTKVTLVSPVVTIVKTVGVPVNKLKSPVISGVITSPITMANQIVCNGMIGSVSKQSQPCTIKTVVPKSVIKTVPSVTNSKIVAATMKTANLLTISNSTSSALGSIIVSKSSSYTLPKSSTVVTWNASSVISTPSPSPTKNLISITGNKLPANLKLANSGKSKNHAQMNAKFVETIEKTTFLKTESLDETTTRKQCNVVKLDSHLRHTDAPEKNLFYSNPSSTTNFNRNSMQSRTPETSHYAISPTLIHSSKTTPNDSMNNEIYYRQVKRKLPAEVNDNRNCSKRNVPDSSVLTHAKILESKSWSEVENDLVRLSQEERSRKIKEESPSPPPGIISISSPEQALKGKEWCFSPTSHIVHLSQTKGISQPARSSIDNVVKAIVSRSPNMSRPIEPPKFDTNTLCRKSLSVSPNQNKYVLSNKQLSPQIFQQSSQMPAAYANRKSSQLSINNTCSKNNSINANLHEYQSPQHPSSRIQMKSDHQYSSNFESNGRLLNEMHNPLQSSHNSLQTSHSSLQSSHNVLQSSHNALQSSHNSIKISHNSISPHNALQSPTNSLQNSHSNSDIQSKLRHTPHISPQQKQHISPQQKQQQQQQQQQQLLQQQQQQQHQQQSVHGVHLQGKYIGLQSINQSMSSQLSHSRLLEEQLKAHQKDGRNKRSEQEYQQNFANYSPRFS